MFIINLRKLLNVLFFLLVIMTLSVFRIREYGNESLDYQIILKLITWSSFGGVAILLAIKKGFFKLSTQEFSSLILFFYLLFSAFYSSNIQRTVTMAAIFLFFWIGLKIYTDINPRAFVMDKVINSLFLFLILSIVIYFAIPELGRQGLWIGNDFIYSNRMTGLSGGANSLGEIAGYFCLFCIWKLENHQRKKLIWRYLVFLAIGLAILLASWNKMGIGSFIIGCLILKSKNTPFFLLAGLLLASIVGLILAVFGINSLASSLSRYGDAQEVLSFTGRLYIWPVVLEAITNSPFFGNGFGVMFATNDSSAVGFVAAHAHNLILQCLSTIGILGLSLFLITIYYSYKSAFLKADFLVLSVLTVGLIRGLTESGLFMGSPNVSLIIWLIMVFLSSRSA